MSDFKPIDELERLVIEKDSQGIVLAVLNGARLTRVDVLGEYETFQLTVDAAMVLAFIGLPKEMRKEAVDFVERKCGKDSDLYDFLSVEYRLSEKRKKPEAGEKKLLAAIKKKDDWLICDLCKEKDCCIDNDFPNEYIPYLGGLQPYSWELLFDNGLYMRVRVLLLQQLMTPETGEPVPPELASLGTKERYGMIRVLIRFVAWRSKATEVPYHEDLGLEIDIWKFRGRVLRYFVDEGKSWGMYDLWSNKMSFGCRNWQKEAFDKIIELLNDLGISFKAAPRNKTITFKIQIPDEGKMLDYKIILRWESILVYTKLPYVCPKAKFPEMLEYFNYVNANLATCSFHYDGLINNNAKKPTAAIRLKSNIPYSETLQYPAALCYYLIASHMRVLEQYGYGLKCVISGKKTPEDAWSDAWSSTRSNFCDWYDETEARLMIYHFPGENKG